MFRGCERHDVHGGWEALMRMLCSIVLSIGSEDYLVGAGEIYGMTRSSFPFLIVATRDWF